VSLAKTARFLGDRGKATQLAVLVDGVDDPVGFGIASDGLVGSINKNDFIELEGRILANPVRVEYAKSTATATDTLLSNGLEVALGLQMIDTMGLWFAIGAALWHWALATTTANSNAVNHETLGGAVSQTASFVGPGRLNCPVHSVELTVLPAPQAK